MDIYSYHIFYFPFKWELPEEEWKTFSEQVDLTRINVSSCSMWERVQLDNKVFLDSHTPVKEQEELFGERQYFFDFVHPVLYDMNGMANPIIHHYERREVKEGLDVEYHIEVKDRLYVLKVDALNLNLYSTGVGILSFYLINEKEDQKDELSIRNINQFGRRIMPPHSKEFVKGNRSILADSIQILGLKGQASLYKDEFDYEVQGKGEMKRGLANVWEPARFIKSLIGDLSQELKVTPVIDDRMLVNCWYGNNELSKLVVKEGKDVKDKFISGDFWYKYVFVDDGSDETCQNEGMKEQLLKDSTYFRWQKYGTLYGVSRYSIVALTDEYSFSKNVLSMHMRTIYSRMFELVIIQRASILRFSGEVTKVGGLNGKNSKEVAERIGSLYKEYIRFVNQIYFRNITIQDQGGELYDLLMNQFNSAVQIKDLDDEIGELHQYITLMIDQKRNENSDWLNWLAAAFLPATLLTGLFGMNRFDELACTLDFWGHLIFIFLVSILIFYLLRKKEW